MPAAADEHDESDESDESDEHDDDPLFTDELNVRQGVVSLWLDVSFDEDNLVIGWYDHDHQETSGTDRPVPVRGLLTGFSYWRSWIDAAVAAAEASGVTEASQAFLLYDYHYDAPVGRWDVGGGEDGGYDVGMSLGPDPHYLGSFPYSRTAG